MVRVSDQTPTKDLQNTPGDPCLTLFEISADLAQNDF